MTVRTSQKTVTFNGPFALSGVDEILPGGAYTVELDEEPLEGISFLAYRRVSTRLHLGGKPGSRVLNRVIAIDPKELDAAIRRDREHAVEPVGIDAHQESLPMTAKSRREVTDRQAIERGEDEGMMVHSGQKTASQLET